MRVGGEFAQKPQSLRIYSYMDANAIFTVTVDTREPMPGIAGILENIYHAQVTRAFLATGDYIINKTIAVERKTDIDFIQSIIDGRLFRQAARLKQAFQSSAVIIEGQNLYNSPINVDSHSIKGALVSLALVWHIPVLFSNSPEDTALLIWLIGNQNISLVKEWYHRFGQPRHQRFRKQELYVLQGLPGVGPKLAVNLLDHFGSVENAMTASVKELLNVPNIGKAKATTIRSLLEGDKSSQCNTKIK